MKIAKILLLLGFYLVSSESTDIITTSHVVQGSATRSNKILPKQHFCSQKKVQKLRCLAKNKMACKNAGNIQQSSICGFDKLGQKFDFKKQCEACQVDSINYYFKGTCDKAPQICKKTQECVNSICVEMLQQPEYANKVVCNSKTDCPNPFQLCVANKCLDKRQLPQILKNTQKKHPQIGERSRRVRQQAKAHEFERRQRQKVQFEELDRKLQQWKSKGWTGGVQRKSNVVSN